MRWFFFGYGDGREGTVIFLYGNLLYKKIVFIFNLLMWVSKRFSNHLVGEVHGRQAVTESIRVYIYKDIVILNL